MTTCQCGKPLILIEATALACQNPDCRAVFKKKRSGKIYRADIFTPDGEKSAKTFFAAIQNL